MAHTHRCRALVLNPLLNASTQAGIPTPQTAGRSPVRRRLLDFRQPVPLSQPKPGTD